MKVTRQIFGWKALLAAVLCAVLQSSCGGSSSNTPAPAAPSPGVASPSPSPSSSGGSSLSWVQVSDISQCPSHPLDCPSANGFNIQSNGAFSIDSQSSAGNIHAGDLAQINEIASQYAANAGALGFSCSPTPSIPGAPGDTTVTITFSDGSSQTIYSIDTAASQTCFLGSIQNATALYQRMQNMASKYNPTPTPAPSPSPSPSPSSSP